MQKSDCIFGRKIKIMAEYDSRKISLNDGKEILLRHLNPTDVEQYIAFSNCIAHETKHTLHYIGQESNPDSLKQRFQASIHSPWQYELGGFENNRLISHLCFYKPRPFHPYEKHIIEFAIKIVKDFCSNGLGSHMLLIMEDIARKTEIKRIQGLVRTSNSTGINFYKKHGYEIEGMKKQAVIIDGVYENEFYIAKTWE